MRTLDQMMAGILAYTPTPAELLTAKFLDIATRMGAAADAFDQEPTPRTLLKLHAALRELRSMTAEHGEERLNRLGGEVLEVTTDSWQRASDVIAKGWR